MEAETNRALGFLFERLSVFAQKEAPAFWVGPISACFFRPQCATLMLRVEAPASELTCPFACVRLLGALLPPFRLHTLLDGRP